MTLYRPMSATSQAEPQCVAVEERLIATLLSYPEVFPHLVDFLAAEYFNEPLFGRIFEAITEAHARDEHWTVLTIMAKFRGDPAVLELGKPCAYFARLAANAGSPASAFDYARMVVVSPIFARFWWSRRLSKIGQADRLNPISMTSSRDWTASRSMSTWLVVNASRVQCRHYH
jgi:replicative DNA helicase